MNIFKADKEDLKMILSVINESNRDKYKAIIPPKYFKEPVLTYNEILELFEKMTFFTYKSDEGIVGVAALESKSDELGEMHWVYILPRNQRSGIGTALVKYIESEAKKKRYKILRVPTSLGAYWARNFYIKLGYRLVEETPTPEGGVAVFEKIL